MSNSHSEQFETMMSPCQRILRFLTRTERIATYPYFSPACLAGFDANCDRGLEQVVYLHCLIEDDSAQAVSQNLAAAAD